LAFDHGIANPRDDLALAARPTARTSRRFVAEERLVVDDRDGNFRLFVNTPGPYHTCRQARVHDGRASHTQTHRSHCMAIAFRHAGEGGKIAIEKRRDNLV